MACDKCGYDAPSVDKMTERIILSERNKIFDDMEAIIKKNLWGSDKDGKAIALQFEEYRKDCDVPKQEGVTE